MKIKKTKKIQDTQMKDKLQLFALPDVETYYKPIANKTVSN